METQAHLVITCGLPGSGKTTYLKDNYPSYPITGYDTYIKQICLEKGIKKSDLYKYISLNNLISNTEEEILKKVYNNINFAFDHVNMAIENRNRIFNIIRLLKKEEEYKKTCIYLRATKANLSIINHNLQLRGDDYLIKDTKGFYDTFEIPTLDEGFDEILIYDIQKASDNTKTFVWNLLQHQKK